MAEANVDAVRAVYAAWARADLPGPPELLDDEIEYVNPPEAAEPGTRRGIAEFARAVERAFEEWEISQLEPEEMTAAGDEVAVVVRYRARGRTSGVEVAGRES